MQALKRRKRRAPTGRLCVGAFFISEFGLKTRPVAFAGSGGRPRLP